MLPIPKHRPEGGPHCVLLPCRTLSLKQLRKLICSEDFELPEKALDAEKDFFKAVVDEVESCSSGMHFDFKCKQRVD